MQKYYCYVQKNRLFWASCRNITGQEPGAPGFSCRANFGVREEILVFRRNIHLCSVLEWLIAPRAQTMPLIDSFHCEDVANVGHSDRVNDQNGQYYAASQLLWHEMYSREEVM